MNFDTYFAVIARRFQCQHLGCKLVTYKTRDRPPNQFISAAGDRAGLYNQHLISIPAMPERYYRTRQCRFPTVINCRDLGTRRALISGNINSDVTGIDMIPQRQ